MDSAKPKDVQKLNDKDLEKAVGGGDNQVYWAWNGKFYKWQGSADGRDCNERYLCPKCGGPVHLTGEGICYGDYTCDSCYEDWWYEEDLIPNVKNWRYREITQWDYDARFDD